MLKVQFGRTLLFSPLFLVISTAIASAQATPAGVAPYARKNSFGVLFAYANDSSHIFLGDAEQRKLLNVGLSYSRKLILNHAMNWQYDGEVLPVTLESDPLTKIVIQQTSPTQQTNVYTGLSPSVLCAPQIITYDVAAGNETFIGTETITCSGRQWTYAGGLSPIGTQLNFSPARRIQPLLEAHGGFLYAAREIPIEGASAFNFTFDVGAGLEWYRTRNRSLRFEYRYHHTSNANTAPQNPGIDNGLLQVSYVFGH